MAYNNQTFTSGQPITANMIDYIDDAVDRLDEVVENLTTKETMQLNDDESLEKYKTYFELLYSKYYELNYYDNKVVLENKKLISTTNINYKKIDKDKLISIDSNNKNLFTNDNVRLTTLKKIYENNGAKCKYI